MKIALTCRRAPLQWLFMSAAPRLYFGGRLLSSMTERRWWVSLLGCVLAGWWSVGAAQTVYKWTDQDGVVHFSDSPPPQMDGVELKTLPAGGAKPGRDAGAEQAAAPEATPNAKAEGPARVTVVSHESPRTGPSAMHILGEVKNVGGADAQRVIVTISAIDRSKETPCLRQEAEVSPSTLHPGESGSFELDVDSPCLYADQLYGDPGIEIAPDWD